MLTINSDPFLRMIESNKTYGFTIAVKELKETVPNIFRYASAYKRVNNLTSQGLWEMFVEPQPDVPKRSQKMTPVTSDHYQKKFSEAIHPAPPYQISTPKQWRARNTICAISGRISRSPDLVGLGVKSTRTSSR